MIVAIRVRNLYSERRPTVKGKWQGRESGRPARGCVYNADVVSRAPFPLTLLCLCGLVTSAVSLPGRCAADVLVPRGDALVLRQAQGGELPISVRALVSSRTRAPDGPKAAPGPAPGPGPGPAPGPGAGPGPAPGSGPTPGEITAQVQGYRFPSFRTEGDALASEITGDGIEIALRLSWEAGSGFTLSVTARPRQPAWVGLLALELDLEADGVVLLGRDLRPLALAPEGAAVLGRLDPKWISLQRRGRSVLTLLASDEIDGVQVRRAGGRVRLQVDLLAVEARPFFHFANCTTYWKDPNQRLNLPVRLIDAGEALRGQVNLYPGGPLPLAKGRFPDGRRAALVITDHADQTAAPTLRTIAGGTSDMNDPRWGQGGLLGYGLPITKALWLKSGERDPKQEGRVPGNGNGNGNGQGALGSAIGVGGGVGPVGVGVGEAPGPELELMEELGLGQADESGGGRPQLDDPQVVALADRLHAAGWEIIPHSATPMTDSRELTQRALEYFRRYGARSWIDHQPYTNCEALVNQGYRQGRYGIADLLHAHGYRYAWSGLDAPPGDLNLLQARRLDRYASAIWPVGRLSPGTPDTLWLFRSMLAFIETQRFFDVYNIEALDRLERERGLHISHTYLEDFHPPRSWFGKRNLLVAGPRPREVVLDPRLDALFSGMAARVARGSLWVPTLSRLGDHLRAMAALQVTLEADGTATLRAEQPVPGATFVLPRAGLQVRVNGRPPKGVRYAEGETSFWVDVPARRPLRVQLRGPGGQPINLLQGGGR